MNLHAQNHPYPISLPSLEAAVSLALFLRTRERFLCELIIKTVTMATYLLYHMIQCM